jgi:thiamine biosynthesis protein ThiI
MEFRQNERLIVVRFGELWLKGHNRNKYIRQLEQNIREQLGGESFVLQRYFDRLILRLDRKSKSDSISRKLQKVFGVSAFETAVVVKPTMAQIAAMAKKMLSAKPRTKSVKINSHRSNKQLPFNSVEVVDKLKKVADKLGVEPMTKGYERELNVSITKDAAFLSLDRQKGAGGLPVGSSGKAVILMSGGIDSPVAAWYAMKRGLVPVYVHLHAFQDADEAVKSKVPRIIRMLAGFYPHYKTYLVPSHIFQASSFKYGKYELILLKAFMLELAERVAEKEGAEVIYTGESLGQVASQTPENLAAEQYGVEMPILRPLIGFDKEEIIKVARMIGTFEESIKPYKDVCSINSRNPKLKSEQKEIAGMLSRMKIKSIISRSFSAASILDA